MKLGTPAGRSNPVEELQPAAGSRPRSGAGAEGEDERALVSRAQGGDQDAFRVLVERHRDRAYGLALRILRSHHEAEDAAQESFVRAWLALPRFRGEAGFATWLYRIVARRAFDRLERLRRARAHETGVEHAELLPAPASGEATETSWRMERLISTLSAAQRAAITLFYYEGRSVEQVAMTLGMPENTVKTHLSRARAALRDGWRRQEAGGSG